MKNKIIVKIFYIDTLSQTCTCCWSWKICVNRFFKKRNNLSFFWSVPSVSPSENYLERELRFVSSWDKNKTEWSVRIGGWTGCWKNLKGEGTRLRTRRAAQRWLMTAPAFLETASSSPERSSLSLGPAHMPGPLFPLSQSWRRHGHHPGRKISLPSWVNASKAKSHGHPPMEEEGGEGAGVGDPAQGGQNYRGRLLPFEYDLSKEDAHREGSIAGLWTVKWLNQEYSDLINTQFDSIIGR